MRMNDDYLCACRDLTDKFKSIGIMFTPLSLFVASAFFLGGCDPEDEESADPVSEEVSETTASGPLRTELRQEVQLRLLAGMVREQDSEQVLETVDEEDRSLLVEAGILVGETPDQRVETDRSQWQSEKFDTEGGIDSREVVSIVSQLVGTNEVTWCNAPRTGEAVVSSYLDEFGDAFATMEEYRASIDDYVDCGSGDL